MDALHVSVLLHECIENLNIRPDGIYIDGTLGMGGHSEQIAARLTTGKLIGIDRDETAIERAGARLAPFGDRVQLVHGNFRDTAAILDRLGIDAVDGMLFDLGVSSPQLDESERGFSYMHDAPLDMRMDPEAKFSAYDVVNTYSEKELDRIFHDYGEERWGRRIAQFIVKERMKKPIERTGELVDIICKAVPKAVRQAANGHPAKRIFQAIRIEVNDELGILEKAFRTAVHHLKPGGRIAIITFHSLEDRIAKQTLKEMARGCICPPELPVCVCHHKPEIRLLGKPKQATADELAHNSRSKSAKLRIAEKLATDNQEETRKGER